MRKMRLFSLVLAGAMLTAALAGCGGKGGDEGSNGAGGSEVIKIGGLAPLTGDVSQYGKAVDNAVKMAVDKINDGGGILGKKIQYISYDEKGTADEAVNAYNRLAQDDKVVAIIGDVTSKPCYAVAQRAVDDNMPLLTPSATQENITPLGKNIFRTCFIDPYQGTLMATYAAQKLGAKSAAILYDSADSYSTGIGDAFETAAKNLGITITNKEGYQGGSGGSKDFKAQLNKIKNSNPDVLMLPVYYSDAALIAQQAKSVGLTAKLLGGDGWDGVIEQLNDSSYDTVANAFFCLSLIHI